MDAYWYPVGQTRPSLASVPGVTYGQASVYSNLLTTGNYNVLVTEHLLVDSVDLKTTITLGPNQKYTFLISRDVSSGAWANTLIQDGVPNPASNLAYVRFINMQPGTPGLTVHVNDPVTGDLINTTPLTFSQVGSYVSLKTALDTSYAFFVTNSSGQILSRLSYQTFTGGNCYTLVYAGDLCETRATSVADSTESALDTLRLRAFDDNNLGNDLTNPIQPSFRFNVVNDIVPATVPYSESYSTDSSIGYTVNGQSFPEFYNFTIPPVPLYQGGGENVATYESGGALEVNYQSLVTPTQLVVAGSATNPAGTNQQILFNAGVATKLSETLIESDPNKPFTFIFYDTVPSHTNHPTLLDSTLSETSHYAIIPVPDLSVPDTVTILFIGGIVPYEKPNNAASANATVFYATNTNNGTTYAPSQGTGISPGTSKLLQIPLAAGTSANFTIIDSIGKSGSGGNRIPGNSSQVTLQAGGIYEVVSEGIKPDPHLLIMHVNANTP